MAAKRGGAAKQQRAAAAAAVAAATGPRVALLAVHACWTAALVYAALHIFYWTPPVRPASSPAHLFSEERARVHVRVLAEEIGLRSVSTPGLQRAHAFIWEWCQRLKAGAAAGVEVTCDMEHYTGSFEFDFVGERFVNAYHNITNIIVHVAAPGAGAHHAVMLVAHHDSPVGSPGAGDDASNVGVMMELAANLVAPGGRLPASPVMFLFSGAEEPLCQSAAAFMSRSPWARRAGVFINLESVGPGGAPIVFQHSGAWVIGAYARGAPHPRGAISAQDIFDAGLVLGDTDYRQLSYRHRGELPGIDIAYLLSGAAYHTDRDTLDAIRPGVLQETGQTLTAAVSSLADTLAAARGSPERLRELLRPTNHKHMFTSVLGTVMLTYSLETARLLHNAPLAMALAAPAALRLLFPGTALPPGEGARVMASAAGVGAATLVAVLALPAGLGALRAWLSGRAMPWFAHHGFAFATYLPAAAAVLLLPWGRCDYAPGGRDERLLPYHALGGALVNCVAAAALTQLGVGMSMTFALWGAAGVLVSLCVAQGVTLPSLLASLALAAWPIYMCAETAVVMSIVVLSRMSLTGCVSVVLGDAIAGLLLGLGAVSTTGLCLLPVAQALLGRRAARRLAGGLALAALAAAAASSSRRVAPYSPDRPKRLMLGHLHHTEPAGPAAAAAAAVPMRVVNSSWVIAGSDSNPSSMLAAAMGFDPAAAQAPTGGEWGVIHPISKLLDLQLFPAAPAAGVVRDLPHVRLLRVRAAPAAAAGGGRELEADLEVFTERPCWGTLTLSAAAGAGIRGWSATPGEWSDAGSFLAAGQRGSGSAVVTRRGAGGIAGGGGGAAAAAGEGAVRSLVVKWTNERQDGPLRWPLSVRLRTAAAGGKDGGGGGGAAARLGLSVDLHVGYVQRTPELAAVQARMPPWSTLSFEATTYVSRWDF